MPIERRLPGSLREDVVAVEHIEQIALRFGDRPIPCSTTTAVLFVSGDPDLVGKAFPIALDHG